MTITAAKLISDIGTPVEVQRALARIAMNERDTETLVRLAKLRDLSPEVDELLSACDDLMVLVAWAERPGRTTEQIVSRFANEKRSRLLAHLASASDLDALVYEAIARRGGTSVLSHLVSNTSVDHGLRLRCAETLFAKLSTASTVKFDYSCLRTDVALAMAASTSTTNLRALACLAEHAEHPELGSEVIDRLIDRLHVVFDRTSFDYPEWDRLAQVTELMSNAGFGDHRNAALLDRIHAMRCYSDIEKTDRQRCIDALASDACQWQRNVERIAGAATTSELHELFDAVSLSTATARWRQAAHREVLRSPLLDVKRYKFHLRELNLATARGILGELVEANRSDVVAMIAMRFDPRALCPPELRPRYVAWLCSTGQAPENLLVRYPDSMIDTDLALSTFTFHTLCDRGWRHEVSAACVEAFGDDATLWNGFNQFIPEWHGSVRSLIDTLTAL